jgi:hypothetical protein
LFYVIFTILLGLEVLDDPPGGYFSSTEPADDVSNFLVGSISAETGSANMDTERPDPSPQKVNPAPSIPAFDTTINRDRPDPPQKEDAPPSIQTFDTMDIDRLDPPDGYSIVAVETPSTDLVSIETPSTNLVSVETPSTDLVAVEMPLTDLVAVETPSTDLVVYDTAKNKKKRKMDRRSLPEIEATVASVQTVTTMVLRETEMVVDTVVTEMTVDLAPTNTAVLTVPSQQRSPEEKGQKPESEPPAALAIAMLVKPDTAMDLLSQDEQADNLCSLGKRKCDEKDDETTISGIRKQPAGVKPKAHKQDEDHSFFTLEEGEHHTW